MTEVDDQTEIPNNSAVLDEKPDSDAIKMFVGQIPRHWNEKECMELFQEYGKVYELNVLRDKASQVSRGCCFVTFYKRQDAISAQNALHNVKFLPQMNHAVQMKPADVENRNERKLFVGMLSKSMNEEDVREMFKEFGQIEECTILREDGRSRGCAFVTFVSRSFAHQAIKAMHQSNTCEGCNKPIVVKFADTQRDKENKTSKPSDEKSSPLATDQAALLAQLLQKPATPVAQQGLASQLARINAVLQQPGIINLIGTVITSLTNATNSPGSASADTPGPSTAAPPQPETNHSSSAVPQAQAQLQLNAVLQQQRMLELLRQNTKDPNFGISPVLVAQMPNTQQFTSQIPAISPQPAFSYPSAVPQLTVTQSVAQSSQLEEALKMNPYLATQLNYSSTTSPEATAALNVNALSASIQPQLNLLAQQQQAQQALVAAAGAVNNGQSKGPDGANLFIYHLPQDFTDTDLYQLFYQFGKILSAKVFIDKQTNLSKCFGFISYDSALAAQQAITTMNGFQINSKRLKVQLKGKKGPQPYSTGS